MQRVWKQSLLASILLCTPLWVRQGTSEAVQARYYPSKETFLAGEPVFILLELHNSETKPLEIVAVTNSGLCALLMGLQVEVNGAKPRMYQAPYCQGGFVGSCLGGVVELGSEETHLQRYLLNDWFDLEEAGIYSVRISQELGLRQPGDNQKTPLGRVEGRFSLSIVPATEPTLRQAYEPILRQLSSSDPMLRYEARNIIATMAPPFLEDIIVGFGYSSDPSEQSAAVTALERLNTPRSRTELARLARETEGAVRQQAIFALGRIGNLAHLPLMQELASCEDRYVQHAAIRSAGRVGGQDAVAFLRLLLRSDDPAVRHDAVFGLANTGSRDAVAAIIEMLQDPDPMVRQSATIALPGITHRSVPGDMQDRAKAKEAARRWARWWVLNWDKAEVFGPTDCGPVLELE